MSKYGVISGLYFPVFGLNTAKYGTEITQYLDTFHAVLFINSSWTIKLLSVQGYRKNSIKIYQLVFYKPKKMTLLSEKNVYVLMLF